MSVLPKILFIVEGERLEREVILRMAQVYGLHCEVTSICTNIHSIYRRLKQDGGYSDVVPVLREILQAQLVSQENAQQCKQAKKTQDDLAKLERDFSSVYLVFDSELHDRPPQDTRVPLDVIKQNVAELKEMLELFNNETDQGKLYVNYPMMESYRDCDDFFDEGYRDRLISIDILFGMQEPKSYKAVVATRRLANIHNSTITMEQFNKLASMNVFKLNWMNNKTWGKPIYDDYLALSSQADILTLEQEFCCKANAVAVLNTLLFFIIDYKGRDFYDNHILQCP